MSFKRFVSICTFVVALFNITTLWAGQKGLFVYYSSTGSAKYADGTDILEGEWFALVWTSPGVTVDLTKDITGDVNSFVGDDWGWIRKKASVAGKCDKGSVMTADEKYKNGGCLQLYLLDTRISSTQLAPLGTNAQGDQFPTVVNAVAPVEGASYTWTKFDAMYHTISGPAPAASAWVKTMLDPVPAIFSLAQAGGMWSVGATNTLSSHDYVLKKASDPKFENILWTSEATNGAAFVTMPLVIEDKDPSAAAPAAFYRIETVED